MPPLPPVADAHECYIELNFLILNFFVFADSNIAYYVTDMLSNRKFGEFSSKFDFVTK